MSFSESLSFIKSAKYDDDNYEIYNRHYGIVYNELTKSLESDKVVHKEIDIDGDYWEGPFVTVVVSVEDKFYKFTFNLSSWTEDGGLGECDICDVEEVFPVEKVVTVYE